MTTNATCSVEDDSVAIRALRKSVGTILIGTMVFCFYAILTVIPTIFWKAWQFVAGPIPKVFGISRFWPDALSFPPLVFIAWVYILTWMDLRDEILKKREASRDIKHSYLRSMITGHPLFCLFGLSMAFAIFKGITLSLAVSLLILVVASVAIFVLWFAWSILKSPHDTRMRMIAIMAVLRIAHWQKGPKGTFFGS